jgi:SP family arabinose:H+ symporter-like MFS transporter
MRLYLILVCGIAALGGFLFGFDTAVISGTLTFVVNHFHFDSLMEGWFVSSALLGCIVGVGFAGKLSDTYGRKKVMILSAALFFLSAIGCMLASCAGMLISFRFVGGLGIGVASMICPLYLSEFSPARVRGRMVALYQLAITAGILGAYFSNAWLLGVSQHHLHVLQVHHGLNGWWEHILVQDVWRSMIGIGLVPSFIFLCLLFAVPESPRWLLARGRETEARKYLQRIHTPEVVSGEIAEFRQAGAGESGTLKELFSPVYRRALLIGILLPFLSQVSGINAVIYYGPSILDKAGFSLGDALGGQVTIGIVNMLFTFVAIFTVDRWGRKPLLFLGIAGAVVSLAATAVLFGAHIVRGPLVLLFLMLFIACFAFSFGPVCWIVVSEIFPGKVRGQAMSLATLSLWVANFLVGQCTPMMLQSVHWGPAATFMTFALLCLPGLWLTWKLIPETRGQSLEAIEQYWKGRK